MSAEQTPPAHTSIVTYYPHGALGRQVGIVFFSIAFLFLFRYGGRAFSETYLRCDRAVGFCYLDQHYPFGKTTSRSIPLATISGVRVESTHTKMVGDPSRLSRNAHKIAIGKLQGARLIDAPPLHLLFTNFSSAAADTRVVRTVIFFGCRSFSFDEQTRIVETEDLDVVLREIAEASSVVVLIGPHVSSDSARSGMNAASSHQGYFLRVRKTDSNAWLRRLVLFALDER